MKKPVVGAVEMWKSGPPFAGFPSPVERVENSLWVFEFSTLSTGRHFHGAFPLASSERSDAGYCSLPRFLRIDSPCISIRWAWCTSRSRMLSASVGSPTASWTGSCTDRKSTRLNSSHVEISYDVFCLKKKKEKGKKGEPNVGERVL